MKQVAICLLMILALSGVQCSWCQPVPDPVIPPDSDHCPTACSHLRDLGCEEGEPLADGTTCEAWCVETQDSGHWLNPTCAEGIVSCEELVFCGE